MAEPITETVEPAVVEPVVVEEPTDELLGVAGKKALIRERETAKAAEKRASDAEARIKEFEDRDKSEAQKLEDRATAAEARAALLESNSLRRDVAEEKGLTPAQAKRLVGTTRDELEADADDIAEAFPPVKPAFQDIAQGARQVGAAPVYRRSQLNDHAFYLANKADILAAVAEGGSRITD